MVNMHEYMYIWIWFISWWGNRHLDQILKPVSQSCIVSNLAYKWSLQQKLSKFVFCTHSTARLANGAVFYCLPSLIVQWPTRIFICTSLLCMIVKLAYSEVHDAAPNFQSLFTVRLISVSNFFLANQYWLEWRITGRDLSWNPHTCQDIHLPTAEVRRRESYDQEKWKTSE